MFCFFDIVCVYFQFLLTSVQQQFNYSLTLIFEQLFWLVLWPVQL